jgi:hypothetical protein
LIGCSFHSLSLVKLNEGFTCIAKVQYFRIYFQFVLILLFCLNDLHKTHFSNDCLYACLKHIVFQFGFSGKLDQYVVRTVSPFYSGVNKKNNLTTLFYFTFKCQQKCLFSLKFQRKSSFKSFHFASKLKSNFEILTQTL